eukprot:CAMPEP_0182458810 /NCGR_PEP_ID=MMETSP1319-20130603/4065_1 /TAXON_ID=172717 /ORGANISM="Bolidomonas pacifica, Strain RCC208" /LENGTH=400 /DNA_ID=CAMNT_0024657567 /DNA_START=185 /DNA_END=1387 /DNA_ORIENTATION=+
MLIVLFASFAIRTASFSNHLVIGRREATSALNLVPHPTSPSYQAVNLVPLRLWGADDEHASLHSHSHSPKNPFSFSFTTGPRSEAGDASSPAGASKVKLSVEDEAYLSRQVQIMVKLKSERDRLKSMLDRDPTEEEWAQIIGVSPGVLKKQIKSSQLAKTKLVTANVGIVTLIAQKYSKSGVSHQDLVQEGNMGLLEAADRFDPSKGFKFCTYASYWIRQRVSRSIADHSRVIRLPVHVHATLGNVAKTTKTMTLELGRKPSLKEVSERMNVPLNKLKMYTESSKKVVSLEGALSNRHDDTRMLGDKIAWDGLTPEEHTVADELRADLGRVMEELDSRERQVVRMRFGLDNGDFRTHDEVAKEVGVSRERVRLIEAKALNKLRHPSRNFRLREYFLALLG